MPVADTIPETIPADILDLALDLCDGSVPNDWGFASRVARALLAERLAQTRRIAELEQDVANLVHACAVRNEALERYENGEMNQ